MANRAKSPAISEETITGTVDNSETPFRRMLQDMSHVATAESEDANFMGDALAAIYNADSDDDIWEADMSGPLNAQHLAGCELALYELSVKYSRGDKNEIQTPWISPDGKKMYVLVTCCRISNAGAKKHINLPSVGEQFQFNTSAQFLTAKLFTFWTRGKFGSGNTMNAGIQATDLGNGQAVLKLVRVPDRALTRTVPNSYEEEAPF